jgi:acetamidase/formamidase
VPNETPYPSYSDIYTIDTATGQGIFVASIPVPGLMGLAFDAADTLYATSVVTDDLYSINLTAQTATLIGNTGVNFPHGGDIFVPVPEPGAWLTIGSGLLAALAIRRRARRI